MTAQRTVGALLVLAAIGCGDAVAPNPESVLHAPGKIVFIRRTSDLYDGEIFKIDPDGGTASSTGITGQLWSLALSPDAAHILFVRYNPAINSNQLVVADSDGTNLRVIDTAKDILSASWNANADLIAYSTGELGGERLFTIKPDGTGKKQLYLAQVSADEPSWEPDGSALAFRWNGCRIGVIDANGGNARLIAEPPPSELSGCQGSPAWSPDGKTIAYVQEDNPSGTSHIRIATLDGYSVQTLTSGSLDASPAWSADGQRIVFVRAIVSAQHRIVGRRLYTISANGGAPTPLTPDPPGFDDSPAWGRK